MRLTERIKIDNNEYIINELTVEEIINLFSSKTELINDSNSQNEEKVVSIIGQIFGGTGYLTEFLKLAMPGTKIANLLKLAPSELMQLWEKLKEVNKYFFEMAQSLNLGETLLLAIREILDHFSNYVVALSKEAMAQEFSSTDTPIS